MALLEEPGIGACCGRESLWETEKNISESLALNHIGIENQDTHPFLPRTVVYVCFYILYTQTQVSVCVYILYKHVKLLERLAYFIAYNGKFYSFTEFYIPKHQK